MANIMLEIETHLRNNTIDCNNDQHIGALSWLAQNHRDSTIRQAAILTLVNCGRMGRIRRRTGGKKDTRKHLSGVKSGNSIQTVHQETLTDKRFQKFLRDSL